MSQSNNTGNRSADEHNAIRRNAKARQQRNRSRATTNGGGFYAGLQEDRAKQRAQRITDQANLAMTLLPGNMYGLACTVAKAIITAFPGAQPTKDISRTSAAIETMRKSLTEQQQTNGERAIQYGIAKARAALQQAYAQLDATQPGRPMVAA